MVKSSWKFLERPLSCALLHKQRSLKHKRCAEGHECYFSLRSNRSARGSSNLLHAVSLPSSVEMAGTSEIGLRSCTHRIVQPSNSTNMYGSPASVWALGVKDFFEYEKRKAGVAQAHLLCYPWGDFRQGRRFLKNTGTRRELTCQTEHSDLISLK